MDLSETIRTHEGPPAAISSPELGAVARYWMSLRGTRPWPARSEIDPLDLNPGIWPSLWLAVNRSFGQVVRGSTLEDLFAPAPRRTVVQRFRRVAEHGEACYCYGTVYVENEGTGWGERLILPLGADESRVSHLFGITVTRFRCLDESEDPRPRVEECFFDTEALTALCQR